MLVLHRIRSVAHLAWRPGEKEGCVVVRTAVHATRTGIPNCTSPPTLHHWPHPRAVLVVALRCHLRWRVAPLLLWRPSDKDARLWLQQLPLNPTRTKTVPYRKPPLCSRTNTASAVAIISLPPLLLVLECAWPGNRPASPLPPPAHPTPPPALGSRPF